jgi:hypothetical protein
MSIIKDTWEIVDQFTKDPSYVTINKEAISVLSKNIKEYLPAAKDFFIGEPRWMKDIKWDSSAYNKVYELVAYELIFDSVNYNYWYGKGTVRPNGSSSYEMSKLLDESFIEAHSFVDAHAFLMGESTGPSKEICFIAVTVFRKKLKKNRYPNIENRIKHLAEVQTTFSKEFDSITWIEELIEKVLNGKESIEETLEIITNRYTGYSSDMFLKRAFLFIIEMNRRVGWYKDEIHLVPIPADYHIPKMLDYHGVLDYAGILQSKIFNRELISSGSLQECEIRASSMKACQLIAKKAKVTMADVDTYLFANRNVCTCPFHLTITTDY